MSVDEYLIVRDARRCVQFASNGLSGLQFSEKLAVVFIHEALKAFQRVEHIGEAEMFNLWEDGGWAEMSVAGGDVKWFPVPS